jgi:uncharacterized protein
MTSNPPIVPPIVPPAAQSAAGSAVTLAALIARARQDSRGAPPVERWEPPFCGDIDMVIRRDGSWYYMGSPIGRPALVELFASVLRKDADGRTYLVTPVEKLGITVEDAHFTAVEAVIENAGLAAQTVTLRTNVGDVVEAGPDHPMRFATEPRHGGLKPYVHVRGRLEALATRAVMHELAAAGEEMMIGGRAVFALRSRGAIFEIMPANDLRALTGGTP